MVDIRHTSGPSLRLPGLELVDHRFELPLDHTLAQGGSIEVYAREVRALAAGAAERPFLVFLQGGPGFEAPRPETRGGWIERATREYRVLLVDQRGTGRSTPLDPRVIAALGDDHAIATHLTHFRADSIVRDLEAMRGALGVERWSVLGQSFGGFCATTYLSLAPQGLREAFITGGLPPLVDDPDPVYARTAQTLRRKTAEYHARFPGDAERLRLIAARLAASPVMLPGGDHFTVGRLQSLGIQLGFRDGPAKIHYLLESAWSGRGAQRDLSRAFLRGVENIQSFDTNPLYALVHEACYAQGSATRWSAQRTVEPLGDLAPDAEPFPFTGEMVFRWTFEDSSVLRPLLGAADLLAQKSDWPRLYDPEVLARNEVPVAAAVYANDMFVDRELSLETAEAIRGCRVWLTDEFEHCGLRVEGERVLGRLIDLVRGEV
ncbi:alpha/beta fold hydrolase [Engelhardtia mirabilis]|uniref:Proline iminopeptidase n=1 Tax=Engelhardtia mirabilis TaxID=2528011 RepID=A0A518BHG1_9BACT|nr:Proline iminopeptidase [Planctomycetes bacterium Pla133]QDV00747.1 Proline iminopeptidase [Planctomycetes bacterium Pla86]